MFLLKMRGKNHHIGWFALWLQSVRYFHEPSWLNIFSLSNALWWPKCVEKQRHYSADKGLYSQDYGLPSSQIWLWELDHKEGRALKNWQFRTVVLEKTPESPLDGKEIIPVNLKGNQLWILIGRTNAEAEAPVFWSPDRNSQLIRKVPGAGKD